jgi:trigger factor
MQVTRQDVSPLNTILNFSFDPEDYKGKFEEELRKYRSKASIRGFRKGMTPIDVIKKMAGKSILVEVINKLVTDSLFNYLEENNLKYLAQPLPLEDIEKDNVYSVNKLLPLRFSFELGLEPEIEIQGVSESDSYNIYDVEIPDSAVDSEFEQVRTRNGKPTDATDTIREKDLLTMDAVELDGDQPKEDGIVTSFKILTEFIKDERVKNEVLTKKAGDSIEFNIFQLEDKGEDHVYKYLLKIPKDEENPVSEIFRAVIKEVSRVEPAELNEAFFESFGDASITDEVSLKSFLKENIKRYYDDEALNYMNREIMEYIMEHTVTELPNDFLKKMIRENSKDVTTEQIETDYPKFAQNMKWNLQKRKLARNYGITVQEQEVKRFIEQETFDIMQRYGYFDYERFRKLVDKRLQNSEQFEKAAEEIVANKIFERINEIIQKVSVPISLDEFTEKVKALNEKLNNS